MIVCTLPNTDPARQGEPYWGTEKWAMRLSPPSYDAPFLRVASVYKALRLACAPPAVGNPDPVVREDGK